MAVFQYTGTVGPVWCSTIKSSIALPITRVSPHAEVAVLDLGAVQERLQVTAVVVPALVAVVVPVLIYPSGLGNPRKSHLMVMSVTVMACWRLRY